MMATTKNTPHLRLVTSEVSLQSVVKAAISGATVQGLLFPIPKPNVLWFVDVSALEQESLVQILQSTPPKWVIDVRAAPRFDLGRVSRMEVFRTFQQFGIRYVDLLGALAISDYRSAQLNPALLAMPINAVLRSDSITSSGPIMFLFDNRDLMDFAASELPLRFEHQPKEGWETVKLSA